MCGEAVDPQTLCGIIMSNIATGAPYTTNPQSAKTCFVCHLHDSAAVECCVLLQISALPVILQEGGPSKRTRSTTLNMAPNKKGKGKGKGQVHADQAHGGVEIHFLLPTLNPHFLSCKWQSRMEDDEGNVKSIDTGDHGGCPLRLHICIIRWACSSS